MTKAQQLTTGVTNESRNVYQGDHFPSEFSSIGEASLFPVSLLILSLRPIILEDRVFLEELQE